MFVDTALLDIDILCRLLVLVTVCFFWPVGGFYRAMLAELSFLNKMVSNHDAIEMRFVKRNYLFKLRRNYNPNQQKLESS